MDPRSIDITRHPDVPLLHGFFGRAGGVSQGIYASLNVGTRGDDLPACLEENKKRAVFALHVSLPLCMPKQEHTGTVHRVEGTDYVPKHPADALVTTCRDVVLGIATADCGPVLLCDAERGVIGAAHAGWRGAVGGILENTVKAMQELGARPEAVVAVLGPCIRQRHYEVSHDVYAVFAQQHKDNTVFFQSEEPGKYLFDLPGYILHRLTQVIGKAYDVEKDTFSGPFFSCRRAASLGQKGFGCNLSAITLSGAVQTC